jgi:hypothetical protein
MTHVVLAAMLAGYLALTPAGGNLAPGERRKHPAGVRRPPIRFSDNSTIPSLPRCVLILDEPFEPCCVYIRIDDVVYALSLRTLDMSSMN